MSNGKKISGAVDWAYKSQLVGITIAEIESRFDSWMSKLYEAKGNCFRICPQVPFVFLKLIFYTASKIVLYYHRVAVARDERGTTDAEIGEQ